MKTDPLIYQQAAAAKRSLVDPAGALQDLIALRESLVQDGRLGDALDVDVFSLSVAIRAGANDAELAFAKWLFRNHPGPDSHLLLGDALFRSGKTRKAMEAWRAAKASAKRRGALRLQSFAQARLAAEAITDDGDNRSDPVGAAFLLAEKDPETAVRNLLRIRKDLLRRGGRADARSMLRAAVALAPRTNDRRRVLKLATELIRTRPTADNLLVAAKAFAAVGDISRATQTATRAVRRAQREGRSFVASEAARIASATVESPAAL